MATTSELEERLGCAIRIARAAGAISLGYFQQEIAIESKDDGSFVTQADRLAEQELRRTIRMQFPADGVLGEEDGEEPGESGWHWILDPIDGTFSFVHGVPLYGS